MPASIQVSEFCELRPALAPDQRMVYLIVLCALARSGVLAAGHMWKHLLSTK